MYCVNCSAAIPEGDSFCPECGTPVRQAPAPRVTTEEALRVVRRNMNWERKAWKINAFAMLGYGGFMLLYYLVYFGGFLILFLTKVFGQSGSSASGAFGPGYMALALMISCTVLFMGFVPLIIIQFHMSSALQKYAEEPDDRNTLNHAGSVGNLVFCYFFSKPALVFAIVNFVYCKTHRYALEQTEQ